MMFGWCRVDLRSPCDEDQHSASKFEAKADNAPNAKLGSDFLLVLLLILSRSPLPELLDSIHGMVLWSPDKSDCATCSRTEDLVPLSVLFLEMSVIFSQWRRVFSVRRLPDRHFWSMLSVRRRLLLLICRVSGGHCEWTAASGDTAGPRSFGSEMPRSSGNTVLWRPSFTCSLRFPPSRSGCMGAARGSSVSMGQMVV